MVTKRLLKSNLSECALKTPTAKWAKKLGFETCEVMWNEETVVEVVMVFGEREEN